MEINTTVNKTAPAAGLSGAERQIVRKAVKIDNENYDTFIKSVDSYLEAQRQRQKREEEIAKQNAADAAVRKRRRMKLLLKKHDDYRRFLEGTALKRALTERERIRDPHIAEGEIKAGTDAVTDAALPLFIRVR